MCFPFAIHDPTRIDGWWQNHAGSSSPRRIFITVGEASASQARLPRFAFQIARIWISLDGDGGLRAGTATANRRAEVAAASVAVSGCLSGGKRSGEFNFGGLKRLSRSDLSKIPFIIHRFL